jgi:hypothetical protein
LRFWDAPLIERKGTSLYLREHHFRNAYATAAVA